MAEYESIVLESEGQIARITLNRPDRLNSFTASMRVELSVRSKSLKSEDTGVVRWAVEIYNQRDELVATYDLLTENVP